MRQYRVHAYEDFGLFYNAERFAKRRFSAQVYYAANGFIARGAKLQEAVMGIVSDEILPIFRRPVLVRRRFCCDMYGNRIGVSRHHLSSRALFFLCQEAIRPRIVDSYPDHLADDLGCTLSVKEAGGQYSIIGLLYPHNIERCKQMIDSLGQLAQT